MADQGKWFKLWISALADQHLDNLELEDFARWVKLGAYIKAHGKDGKISFPPPYRALINMFRLPTIDACLDVLKLFPNCVHGERSFTVTTVTNSTVTYEIEYQNWFKYQGDFSNDRVRKFRDKKRHAVTAQEEKRSRREETRQEEKRSNTFVRPTILEVIEFVKAEKLTIDPTRFWNYYEANGWRVGRNPMKDWKAAARNWKTQGEFNVNPSKPANAFVAPSGESAKYDRS